MSVSRLHQHLVDLAARIVHRQRRGQFEPAAELIMRVLATSDAEHTKAFAIALTEQGLRAVEGSRIDAVERGHRWRPAMMHGEEMITPDHTEVAPIPLAVRMLDALHRSMVGEREALGHLDNVYGLASAADHNVFSGMFAALAAYAAYGLNEQVEVLDVRAEDCVHTAQT